MLTRSRQKGGVGMPLVAIAVAAVVVIGTILFLRGGESGGPARVGPVSGVKAAPPKAQPPVKRIPAAINLRLDTPETRDIMKGNVIKTRDVMGNVVYKHRNLFEGVRGDGQPVVFAATTRSVPMLPRHEKLKDIGKARADLSQRAARRKNVKSPPIIEMENGKLVSAIKAKYAEDADGGDGESAKSGVSDGASGETKGSGKLKNGGKVVPRKKGN